MSKMSADDAKAIAVAFVDSINPDYPYKATVQDNDNASLYNTERTFQIKLSANDVDIANQGGIVTVDTEKGEVTNFNIWYIPDTKEYFTGIDQFVSADTAKQAYMNNFPMKLVYRSYYDEDNKEIFYPVYVTTDNYGEYINGVTGEKETIDFYRTFRTTAAGDFGANEDAAASKAALTPQELEEIDNISGLISKEDVQKQLRSNKVLAIPRNAQVDTIRLSKGWHDETYHYAITLLADDDYINAVVDAKTGEINSYYRSYNSSDNTENRNDAAFRELAGSKADEFIYNEETQHYVRNVNGIEVEGNDAYMTFSDGTLVNYSISYSEGDFPSIDGVMSAEAAAEKMFEQSVYEPVCVIGYNGDNEACLYPVYSLDALSINPFTGKAVDWQNNEITPGEDATSLTYSDISGHWSEAYVNALAEYGIGFEGGEFKPDEKITQSDLLTLLGTIYGGGDVIVFLDNKVQADGVYSRAISNNIINEDERDDNAVLTRETASIYLIRAIGAEQYAKYNDIYVTPFDDVTENKGYIAL
ncbi:MAG: S-layer homology domain-containing protein, partial [Clostridia bacterium]|nr:S-layer homology domain-containing protein [Clostridia bacterium]